MITVKSELLKENVLKFLNLKKETICVSLYSGKFFLCLILVCLFLFSFKLFYY